MLLLCSDGPSKDIEETWRPLKQMVNMFIQCSGMAVACICLDVEIEGGHLISMGGVRNYGQSNPLQCLAAF